MSIQDAPMIGKADVAPAHLRVIDPARQRLRHADRVALALLITEEEITQVHRMLQRLSAKDEDHAALRNGAGFGKFDVAWGHRLAQLPRLSPGQAVAAAHRLHKYRRQLPEDYRVWTDLLSRRRDAEPQAGPADTPSQPPMGDAATEPNLWTTDWARWFVNKHQARLTRVSGDDVVAEDATIWADLLATELNLGWYHDDLYGLTNRADPLFEPVAGRVDQMVPAIANALRAAGVKVEKSVTRGKDVAAALRMILPHPSDGDWLRWDREHWNRQRGIVFSNGVLDLDTLTLHPLTPDDRATWRISYRWVGADGIPPAAAQFWLMHFQNLFGDDAEAKLKTRALLVRSAVALAPWIRGAQWQKALMLIGPGQNGKGTWIRLWMKILGAQIQSLAVRAYHDDNRFGLTNLKPDTLVAVTPDMDEGATLRGTERWKKIIGDDPIDWERKNRDVVSTQFIARVWMAGPVVPKVADRSQGMYRRLKDTIILFDRKQPEDPGYELKMQRAEHIESLLVLAVQALHRVAVGQDPMPVPASAGAALEDYRRQIDPWEQWIDADEGWLVQDPAGWVPAGRLWEVYRHWYEDYTGERYPKYMPRTTFGRKIAEHCGPRVDRGQAAGGKSYPGIRIQPEWDRRFDD
ncbi:DNA primase family protein [Sulfobacillus harzensis]|uniref:SF3 helicase domain-containing protein n=1 Tax=Sulfobacillus harzensis TaxID=2729629 RepID=A0A7Y0Q338_9FIRM|nr:DUF5906 domain-containing protein [Sulfobacillus harzensis]NMP21799.1 hypothetical protein [Sulfobacillus harzensis]